MVKVYINKTDNIEINSKNAKEIYNFIAKTMHLTPKDFYLEQNGKRLDDGFDQESSIHFRLCILGGKGGFGSMLRAIGAQIEKTTNREACRDLSGRRLRDINEEKRLKAWLEKQEEREREAEERKKRKIEKLLAVPKHEFKDEEYEETRSKLTEKVYNALEEGLKKSSNNELVLKRKNYVPMSQNAGPAKKKKSALWLEEDISTSDDTDSTDDDSDYLENVINEKPFVEKDSPQNTHSAGGKIMQER